MSYKYDRMPYNGRCGYISPVPKEQFYSNQIPSRNRVGTKAADVVDGDRCVSPNNRCFCHLMRCAAGCGAGLLAITLLLGGLILILPHPHDGTIKHFVRDRANAIIAKARLPGDATHTPLPAGGGDPSIRRSSAIYAPNPTTNRTIVTKRLAQGVGSTYRGGAAGAANAAGASRIPSSSLALEVHAPRRAVINHTRNKKSTASPAMVK
jgi:hypothetical protein